MTDWMIIYFRRTYFVLKMTLKLFGPNFRDAFRWHTKLILRRNPVLDRVPLMSFSASRWLDANLSQSDRVFEYGSGGSTLFLLARVGELISVEHDPGWHRMVEPLLLREGSKNHSVLLREPQVKDVGPDGGESRDFSLYVETIDQFEDDYFDLIIVDGRARPECVSRGISKVKPGGILLLDDADRPQYQSAIEKLDGWTNIILTGISPYKFAFGVTGVWKKPGPFQSA